jgi:hypothetical protein
MARLDGHRFRISSAHMSIIGPVICYLGSWRPCSERLTPYPKFDCLVSSGRQGCPRAINSQNLNGSTPNEARYLACRGDTVFFGIISIGNEPAKRRNEMRTRFLTILVALASVFPADVIAQKLGVEPGRSFEKPLTTAHARRKPHRKHAKAAAGTRGTAARARRNTETK